jgi:ribosome biogenesis protein Nip4
MPLKKKSLHNTKSINKSQGFITKVHITKNTSQNFLYNLQLKNHYKYMPITRVQITLHLINTLQSASSRLLHRQ